MMWAIYMHFSTAPDRQSYTPSRTHWMPQCAAAAAVPHLFNVAINSTVCQHNSLGQSGRPTGKRKSQQILTRTDVHVMWKVWHVISQQTWEWDTALMAITKHNQLLTTTPLKLLYTRKLHCNLYMETGICRPRHQIMWTWTTIRAVKWLIFLIACWLIELWFLRLTQHKIGHFGDFPRANLLAWYGKTKPNTTKAHIHQSKEIYYNTKWTQKIKPGLDASYDIRPGNGEGLFCFWHFINM